MARNAQRSMDGRIVSCVAFIYVNVVFYFLSYAPWCPACRQFKKVWSDFSNEMLSKNVKVAALDVDQYPSLSGRFRISALPTVF